mgnify:CR=1 FL=1
MKFIEIPESIETLNPEIIEIPVEIPIEIQSFIEPSPPVETLEQENHMKLSQEITTYA